MKKTEKLYYWFGSRKMTWVLCGIGIVSAALSFYFLPETIPVHFANGVANGFGNKTDIFQFPFFLLVTTVLSGMEKIKYVLTHSRSFPTEEQYNLFVDSVLVIILIAESYVIYASLA